jgi:hypothetical protein
VGLSVLLVELLQGYLILKFWRTSLSSISREKFKFLHKTATSPHPIIVAHYVVSERFSGSRRAKPELLAFKITRFPHHAFFLGNVKKRAV